MLSNLLMVATLFVYNVTLAFNDATNKAVRQAKISALVEEGHKMTEAKILRLCC